MTQEILKYSFGLTSNSKFKLDCISTFISKYNINCAITDYTDCKTPQPVGIKNTFICANKRLSGDNKNHRFLISIVNGITVTKSTHNANENIITNICALIIKDTVTGKIFDNKETIKDTFVVIPDGDKFYQKLVNYPSPSDLGLAIKISDVIAKCYSNKEYKYDWAKYLCGISKVEIINKTIASIWDDVMRETVMSKLRFVTGILPKGIAYQDYMSAMYTFTTRKFLIELLIREIPIDIKDKIDMVCGPEFKGYCLAHGVADELKVGLFPLRLEGNLPPPTVKLEHSKKYRYEHALEIDTHEYNPLVSVKGINVLLIDYIRDTGESIKKMIELVESTGGKVIYWLTVSSVSHHKELAKNTLENYPGSIIFD
jgi:adenine phosphoribosyltransferase